MTSAFTASPFVGKTFGVTVSHLTKKFGRTTVLTDINLEVKPGEIFCIMGPSGSGKSVLLKHVAGLEQATNGEVRIGEFDAADPETRNKVHLALVFQAGALFSSLSVYDNLALYPREHRQCNEAGIRERVMHALSILSLEKAANKFPSDLSGGMRKRVAIARALVMEPQLLLYDEPTSELDPVMSATLTEIIATLREQTAVTSLVVTHDRDLAFAIADRLAFVMDGKIRGVGTPAEFKHPTDPVIANFLNPVIDLKNPRFKQLENSHE
ncbi:ATP-binding cassette domain-containing protein [Opitutus sp. GAS368]|jgi:phospholipid/cholesterol/gamma-HCH transport system ATP-binding protein|uniref:ABC transporter ATP-binding protein n=1 Tax=Opitutus sp. GAS368 TaxID=1882749 RepID=UPI00087A3553|nr:ATP-binding cassette domain-containing protein [Opitutus sp. GAS368]SDR87821.1 phospholipid/cholesterol/gamma-HCH transport system ATP-binding protein [Opitutus sp. GAS368]